MAKKQAKPRRPRAGTAEPAPGGEPDLTRLGAHESRNASPQPPTEEREQVNARLRRAQDYQGL